jgi:hypothetical protein
MELHGTYSECNPTVVRFWLDANVFIAPYRQRYYTFDVAPTYWTLLIQRAADGTLASVSQVYDELAGGQDPLAVWVRQQKDTPLFVQPDQAVQQALGQVAAYVSRRYRAPEVTEFLDDADPWFIAHALAHGGKVVTFETRAGNNSLQIQIPNVCDHFSIEPISLFQMFSELNIVLEFKG